MIPHKILQSCLERAIERFNSSIDKDSLLSTRDEDEPIQVGIDRNERNSASEDAISHRLAYYFERVMIEQEVIKEGGKISVDCEYNKHLGKIKTHEIENIHAHIVKNAGRTIKHIEDKEGYSVFLIIPDIIVHERNTDAHNLLVVEVKKSSNPEPTDYDDLKLICFTNLPPLGYGYLVGARVITYDNIDPDKRKLQIIEWYPKSPEDDLHMELASRRSKPKSNRAASRKSE